MNERRWNWLGHRDWSIRDKLIIPLFVSAIIGGGAIATTVAIKYYVIKFEVLPQERTLDQIRGLSIELLSEYREFMLVPEESTYDEIGDVAEELAANATIFERVASAAHHQTEIVSAIHDAVMQLTRLGEDAVSQRRRLLAHIDSLSGLENEIEDHISDRARAVGEVDERRVDTVSLPGPAHGSDPVELMHELLSELGEYTLLPNEKTREEIEEVDQKLVKMLADLDRNTTERQAQDEEVAAGRKLIFRALQAGRDSIALTSNFLTSLEALEEAEDDLLKVLAEGKAAVADGTDYAFLFVVWVVIVVMILGLLIVFLVGYAVSQGIATSLADLGSAAKKLRDGHLSVRAEVRDRDEIGALAVAFNKMAASIETNIEQRESAERSLKTLNRDLAIARDQAEAANRAKSEFLAAMSHELRTPLNTMNGFAELMQAEPFGPIGSPEYLDYLGDIRGAGQHLLALINDILDLSKVEAGVAELRESDLAIADLAELVRRLIGPQAVKGELVLDLDVPAELPKLRADKRKLKQILINLLSNAVKFTPAGGRVALKVRCELNTGYVFQVVDSGIGIAPDDIPKALSMFGQVDSSLSRQYEGTGLGLPLTKALVELHGGTLELESQLGIGTTATVTLPVERIVREPEETGTSRAAPSAAG